MSKTMTFLVGFAVGGAVGWVLGILSAPQSGRETLDSLGEKAIELRDRAEEAADRVRDEIIGALDSTVDLNADFTR
ncbi:MAG: YtxH domain-containing protein [Anaerolineae bacterium]|jgi:gas vesicle protein